MSEIGLILKNTVSVSFTLLPLTPIILHSLFQCVIGLGWSKKSLEEYFLILLGSKNGVVAPEYFGCRFNPLSNGST